jgi:hypothetical protein
MPVEIAILMFAMLALIAIAVRGRRRRPFNVTPHPSDEEFLAQCRPGVDREIALKVRRIVAEHFAVPYGRVMPSTTFIEDLNAG